MVTWPLVKTDVNQRKTLWTDAAFSPDGWDFTPHVNEHKHAQVYTERLRARFSFDGVLKLALFNHACRVVFRCWKCPSDPPSTSFSWLFLPPSPRRWWREENSVDYTGKPFHSWIQRVCFHRGAQQINANNTFLVMKETSVDGELTSEASSPFVWSCLGFWVVVLFLFF